MTAQMSLMKKKCAVHKLNSSKSLTWYGQVGLIESHHKRHVFEVKQNIYRSRHLETQVTVNNLVLGMVLMPSCPWVPHAGTGFCCPPAPGDVPSSASLQSCLWPSWGGSPQARASLLRAPSRPALRGVRRGRGSPLARCLASYSAALASTLTDSLILVAHSYTPTYSFRYTQPQIYTPEFTCTHSHTHIHTAHSHRNTQTRTRKDMHTQVHWHTHVLKTGAHHRS